MSSNKYRYSTDIINSKFTRLTVLEQVKNAAGQGGRTFKCICDCGEIRNVREGALLRGMNKSCGCLKAQRIRKLKLAHGCASLLGRTPEYNAWKGMKARCYNTNAKQYCDYGGRGVTVCDKWLHSFENFLEDMGEKPHPKHLYSLDKDSKLKDCLIYCPESCSWVTKDIQNNNQRRSVRLTTQSGELISIKQASNICEVSWGRAYALIKYHSVTSFEDFQKLLARKLLSET